MNSHPRRLRAPQLPGTRVLPILLLALLISTGLLPAGAGAAPQSGDGLSDQLLVSFRPDAPGHAKADARRAAGATELSTIDELGVHVWRVPGQVASRSLAGLHRNPHVAFAERDEILEVDGEVIPNDPWFISQWGLEQVEAPTAWATSKGAEHTSIAILDTGVNAVPDLQNKLLPGHNVLTGTSNVTDAHGHGTLSAGVAGAETDNGLDVAGYCWDCSLLPVKIMESSSGTMSDLAKGIVWAADNGADVISMSVSGSSGTTTVANAIDYARGRGSLLVAAAGNHGTSAKRYPAAYADVVGVAASDSNDDLYSWSAYGSWVDVSAPGSNRSTNKDGGVSGYAGTSSATPAVAGVLGLGLATGASSAEVRDALHAGAAPLAEVRYGRVDGAAMLGLLDAPTVDGDPDPAPEPEPEPDGPSAAFSVTCIDLTCDFVDESAAGVGAITSHQWDLGDGSRATGPKVTHTYAGGDTYTVTVTVSDENTLSDTTSATVSVSAPAADGDPESDGDPEPDAAELDLSVTTSKTRGLGSATLHWSGAATSVIDVYVNGTRHVTVDDTGSYTHDTGERGNPTYTYRVCEAGDTAVCSDPITVDSW